jgi:uncharacterized protein (TIGR03032 family)
VTHPAQWPAPEPPRPVAPGLVRVTNVSASGSPGFAGWLAGTRAGLVVTCGDRVLSIGAAEGSLEVDEQRADVVTGLAADGARTVHLATRWQLHRLEDAGSDGDRVLVNQSSWTTGFIGAYDVAVDRSGRVLFSSALCNCVATTAARTNFGAVYVPPFVSELVAEERCHLTGLALDEDGDLAYVTCAAATDERGGWQSGLVGGGVVVDVQSGRVLADGLCLPFSPRVHGGRLFVANAGTGELLEVDRASGAAHAVVRLPGLARGVTFLGDRAVVGCSAPPSEGPYAELPVATQERPRSGLAVVDVDLGTVEHTLTFQAGSGDVWAVAALPETRRILAQVNSSSTDGAFCVDESATVPR